MSKQLKEFQFLSLVDKESIVKYLETLTAGFRSGHINLKSPSEEILLDPDGLLKLEIQAKNKNSRSKLSIKVSWKEQPKVKVNADELAIEAGTEQ